MPINETFYGFVESTTDALLLFEASHRGILPKISRRLQEKERGIIRSGSIFIFDEKESGMQHSLLKAQFINKYTKALKDGQTDVYGVPLVY